jgi:hypothetical protein
MKVKRDGVGAHLPSQINWGKLTRPAYQTARNVLVGFAEVIAAQEYGLVKRTGANVQTA